MSAFANARLTENVLFLPSGGECGETLRLPASQPVGALWLDDGRTCTSPDLTFCWDDAQEDVVVLRLSARGGSTFKELRWRFDNGDLHQQGTFPESFQQWRDDDRTWPIQRPVGIQRQRPATLAWSIGDDSEPLPPIGTTSF